jgi:hypothetical protein
MAFGNSQAMVFLPALVNNGNVTPTAGTTINPVTAVPVASLKPWYMTWWGLGLISVGAFVAYRKFKG